MPVPHHSVFYRSDALPAHPTNGVKALKAYYIYGGIKNYPICRNSMQIEVKILALQ